jgi:hypothetical protein
MAPIALDQLLTRLEEAKHRFERKDKALIKKLLAAAARAKFSDVDSLIRFHEILLFLRAHPHNPHVLREVEKLLSSFASHVERLRQSGVDMIAFDYIEYSGIAGTKISGEFSYGIVRWLAGRYPGSVSIDWQKYEKRERLARVLPRFVPLLYEDSLVEANIPYLEWLRAAGAREDKELRWLLRRFDQLPISEREKVELYENLELKILFDLNNSGAARTNSIRPPEKVYYHAGPLIRRSEVSLAQEINSPPLPLKRLSRARGQEMIDMLRAATTVRYRELYGITIGDPDSVVHARVGRGVEIFLWGLPPQRRLPLRAYHAGFTLKNGVPVDYIEGISLFDRMEVGFNLFYTFRDGESAWIYAQVLRLLQQITGVTCISVDPYQIGFNNDEAIESGAFWFYRKLGFRPTRPELARLTEAEEKKMSRKPGYRSSARVLRRLSQGNIVYEMPGSTRGYWDGFHIRNLGLAVQHDMRKRYGGDPLEVRSASREKVARALGADPEKWKALERRAFDNLALVLALIPDLAKWTDTEKRDIVRIIRAKAHADESRYLRLLQRQAKLRDVISKIGSSKMNRKG